MSFYDVLESVTSPYQNRYETLERKDGFGILFLLSTTKTDLESDSVVREYSMEFDQTEVRDELEVLEENGYIKFNSETGELEITDEISEKELYMKALQYLKDSTSFELSKEDTVAKNKIDEVWERGYSVEEATQQDVKDAIDEFESSQK